MKNKTLSFIEECVPYAVTFTALIIGVVLGSYLYDRHLFKDSASISDELLPDGRVQKTIIYQQDDNPRFRDRFYQ